MLCLQYYNIILNIFWSKASDLSQNTWASYTEIITRIIILGLNNDDIIQQIYFNL